MKRTLTEAIMKKLKCSAAMFVAALLALGGSGAAAAADDIVDTAVKAGSFKTLAAALDAAGLVDALKGEGPFTVFAPTDEAFAKLPQGTVETLLKPENKDQLTAILTYHVVAGRVPAETVVGLKGAVTLNGQRVDIQVEDGRVKVDGAQVVKADIACSNGIIHVIDQVILPASDDLVTTASKAGSFNTLLAAAKAAGLASALSGKQPLTVFAPTDEAFSKLPEGTVESLLQPENRGKLVAILKYHIVPGRVYSEQALSEGKLATLQGGSLQVTASGGQAKVNNAGLVATDIDAANGVIHVIDSVLLPPQPKKVSSVEMQQMIEHAVARGSRAFNHGNHSTCATIYASTMQELLAQGDTMPESVARQMKHVLHRAQAMHCPTQRSWALRRGLEAAHARLAATP